MKNQGDFDIGEEIRLINEENEKLRQKTIEILKSHKVEDNL